METLSAWYREQRISVPVASVTHFSADSKYTTAHHQGGQLLLVDSLVKLAKELPEFTRISRSVLVRHSLITGYREHRPEYAYGADGGFVVVEGVGELRVSRRLAKAIKASLEQRSEV